MGSVLRASKLLGFGLVLVTGACQVVLGDFQVGNEPQPTSTLGTACEPNAFRCEGARLEACARDRKGWDLVMTCTSAGQCDASAVTCHACTLGTFACDGVTGLQACDGSGELGPLTPCATPELCHVAGDRASGSCVPPVCDPGAFSCDENRLLTCSPGRDAWTLVARCASGPLCDPQHATEVAAAGSVATCLTPVCLPGTFACDGATLERCNADQNGWEPVLYCDDAASCNPSDGSCTPAEDGVTACSGADVVRKATEGFSTLASCSSPVLCDAEQGRCLPRSCGKPGTLRCDTGELAALQECADDGSWVVREVCATRALCNVPAGRCFAPACELGAERCAGPEHQRCSGDRTHWETVETCTKDQACGPTGCEPDACTPGAFRCAGSSLDECHAGRWQPKLRCATAALCRASDGTCAEPSCGGPLGDYKCEAQNIRQCASGRETWKDFRPCNVPPALVCNADPALGTGLPVCGVCEPLAFSCSGSDLLRCAGDGQTNPVIASCPGGCSIVEGAPSCAAL